MYEAHLCMACSFVHVAGEDQQCIGCTPFVQGTKSAHRQNACAIKLSYFITLCHCRKAEQAHKKVSYGAIQTALPVPASYDKSKTWLICLALSDGEGSSINFREVYTHTWTWIRTAGTQRLMTSAFLLFMCIAAQGICWHIWACQLQA